MPTLADYPLAESHIAEALRLRLEAHALDPDHHDPAWADDTRANRGVSHDALVAFFQRYAEPDRRRTPLSIQEIDAAVSHADDARASAAYALLLLESGWIQAKDCSAELLKTGPFMRFATGETPR